MTESKEVKYKMTFTPAVFNFKTKKWTWKRRWPL